MSDCLVVVAVVVDARGAVLLAERGGQLVFPQALVAPGEASIKALRRGLRQTLGTDLFDLVRVAPRETHAAGERWQWNLLRLRAGVDPVAGHFTGFLWTSPETAVSSAPAAQRSLYAEGLAGLDLLLTLGGDVLTPLGAAS